MKFTKLQLTDGPTYPSTSGTLVGMPSDLTGELTLPMDSAITTAPYVIRNIDGLGPPDINVFISNPQNGSSRYQTTTVENRLVTLLIGFQPDFSAGQTYETLRSGLYKWLTPRDESLVILNILNGSTSLGTVRGKFDKFEPNIFSKDPQVSMRLSCAGKYIAKQYFDYPNATTMAKNPLVIVNPGDAPSGFRMRGTYNTTDTSLYFGTMSFSFNFQSGDVFDVKTVIGDRYARITRGATTYNLLPYLDPQSRWEMLHGGTNSINTIGASNYDISLFQVWPNLWGV